jgi:hypothetical protein
MRERGGCLTGLRGGGYGQQQAREPERGDSMQLHTN